MNSKLFLHFKKCLLFILVICMTVCQLTPVRSTYALEEDTEVVILQEDVSLREESSKTFILSDKTMQKVIYSIPIHYEENGEWKEIDNTFIDDGLTYVEEIVNSIEEIELEENITDIEVDETSNQVNENESSEINVSQEEVIENDEIVIDGDNTPESEQVIIEDETNLVEENNQSEVAEIENTTEQTEVLEEDVEPVTPVVEENIEVEVNNNDNSQVVGYKNKNGNLDIKFSKKVHQKNMVSIQDDDYKVTWGFKDFENKSNGVVANSQILDNPIEAAYNHIAQQISYSDVISGIDLVYNIDSLSIKENIVIKQKVDINSFTFEYKVNGLELVLNENGDIEALNENGEVIFLLPKPYMYDSEKNYCHDVHYEMSEKNKKYTITIVADKEWLNSSDRVYPITIDPVIQTQQTAKAIKSTFIASDTDYDDTNFDTHFELLVGREASAYYNCRSLFKFTLPTLNRGDMVVDAKFYVAQYYRSFYTTATPDLQINAHMINTSWVDTNVTWNSIKGSGTVDSYYDNTILDYDFIKKTDVQNAANWKVFDVTSAVKQWYNGTANNGILLKSYNESGSHADVGVKGTFWPEDYNNSYNAFPYLLISYRNNKGIESYYDYTSFSTYSAGNVYIDNYSGNLVAEHVDASTYGNKAPISVSHIYNGYMADNNAYYVGKGWKLNVHQTLKPSSQYGLTQESATTYPYVYMDQDGTEHYFIKKDNQYFDEDGLGLELKVISGGYTITDKQDNVMTFNSSGNITSIKDVNNNTINFTYSGNKITKVTSGNGQAINFTYDSNGNLSKITDQAGKVTTYTYSNNLLTQITYPSGKTSNYSYDSNSALQTMTSYDGTSITFSYTTLASGKQVSQIVEKGSNGSNGQTIKFDRSKYNTTVITTSGIDSVINTSDDVKTELQFDNAGRLMSTHSYTDSKDLGASVYEFTPASPNASKSNLEALNKLNKVGSLGSNIMDLAVNTSGDSTETWSSSSSVAAATFTFGTTTEESLFGTNSFKLTSTSCALNGRARFYQNHNSPFAKASTTYTASAYIKTKDIQPVSGAEDYGAAILVFLDAPSMPIDQNPEAADFASEYIIGTTDEQINDGWRRVSVTFTTPADIATIRFNCMIRNATGIAYFDGIQLEQSQVANPNNLLVNACFERTTSKFPRYWTKSGITSTDIADTTIKHSGDRSIKVTSSVNQQKEMYQTVNVKGKEEDTYILSGWSYGKGVDKGIDSTKYELIAKVTYTDGTSVWKDPLKFNTSISGWKYVSKGFDLSDGTSANKTPASITVYARSYGQPNALYFDNIQLIQSDVTTCEYDDEGNMISSNGSSYEYQNSDLIKVTDKEGKETTYTYNSKHQQTSMTTPNGIKTSSVYDGYGNITSSTITNSSNSHSIKTETVYTTDGAFVSETKDEDGYSTKYQYHQLLGLIDTITDAKNHITDYTYDTNDLLTQVTSGDASVQYVYDTNHRLSEIQTVSDDYQFTYDAYGNRTATKINSVTLANYNYQNYDGYVATISYNNGFTETYNYDEYGNLVETYENNMLVSKNQYDSNGTPIRILDYKTNQECVYEYDHKGRLVRLSVFEISNDLLDDRKIYEISWGYDNLDRLVCESRTINGQTSKQTYTYNDKQLLNQLNLGSNVSLNYGYDAFERLTQKTIDTQGTDIQTSYTYATSQRGSNFTTSKVQTETIGDTSYHYTYDEVGNITQIVMMRGSLTQIIQYEYDENNQLIRENNQQSGLTTIYYYDGAGNISDKTMYPYSTEEELRFPITSIYYSYGNTNKLTSYNYSSITYDSLGNPTNYLGKSMSWEGRQLKTVNSGSNSISYTYNSDGLRRTKTVNGQTTVYEYSGTQLIHEQRPTFDLYYQYDESGNLVKITKKQNSTETNYYIATNIRGDVEAIYNESGQVQARYVYDAWGKVKSVLDANNNQITDTNHIGHINPIRYRGYYYDTETSFYYLQSRYYDPEVGRFISADTINVITNTSDNTYKNLYAYCDNNPIVRIDAGGAAWESIFDILSLGASIMEVTFNPADPWAWLGLAGDAIDLLPFVTCVGETIDALRAGDKVVDSSGNIIDTYYNLKKINKGNDLEVHHIVEKRFSGLLKFGETCSSMPSIALPKDVHRGYTNEWRKILKYGSKPRHQKDLLNAVIQIYGNDPDLLGSAIYIILNGGKN